MSKRKIILDARTNEPYTVPNHIVDLFTESGNLTLGDFCDWVDKLPDDIDGVDSLVDILKYPANKRRIEKLKRIDGKKH